jgi:chromosome segregation ATPase
VLDARKETLRMFRKEQRELLEVMTSKDRRLIQARKAWQESERREKVLKGKLDTVTPEVGRLRTDRERLEYVIEEKDVELNRIKQECEKAEEEDGDVEAKSALKERG